MSNFNLSIAEVIDFLQTPATISNASALNIQLYDNLFALFINPNTSLEDRRIILNFVDNAGLAIFEFLDYLQGSGKHQINLEFFTKISAMVLRHAEEDLVKKLMNMIIIGDRQSTESVTQAQIHTVWHSLLEREVKEFESLAPDESVEVKSYRVKRLRIISDVLNYKKAAYGTPAVQSPRRLGMVGEPDRPSPSNYLFNEDLGEISQTKTIFLDANDFQQPQLVHQSASESINYSS